MKDGFGKTFVGVVAVGLVGVLIVGFLVGAMYAVSEIASTININNF